VLVLAFDTSTSAVTVAVLDFEAPTIPPGLKPGETFSGSVAGPKTLAERTEVAANRHGELLAPLINEVLVAAGTAAHELTAIGVGLGPGPFTGLRVGIVTAKAMGDALGIPTYGECSLDVIANRLGLAAYDHDNDVEHGYVVMSDARRKQVYWAEYDSIGQRVGELDIAHPIDVADAIRGRISHVAGAGALLYRDVFADFTVIERDPYPSASNLAELVMGRLLARKPSEALTPLYLRRPDAQPPGPPKQVTPV
jgi:tRNA threonylcarbamoyl adenosine modification protein YeaZ